MLFLFVDVDDVLIVNPYNEDPYAKEFGVTFENRLTIIKGRVLPPPMARRRYSGQKLASGICSLRDYPTSTTRDAGKLGPPAAITPWQHAYWDGKNYNDVIRRYRQAAAAGGAEGIPRRRRAAIPHPPPAAPVVAPPVPAEYEVPPEQFVLREDGDPDDSPGPLVAMRASQVTAEAATTAREEAEIAAAIQATAAVGVNPPLVGDDDDVKWDALANSSDDDDGGDGDSAVDGPAVVYLDSD
ncbi:hypothetical protein ZWY2020_002164 [Hordeum vulgare]|nr:hypothetical protein ZWY2020_002164 [Hordeum vulgare]